MRRNKKPIAFILFLVMILTPCLSFADSYPNQMLDDMIRLDKWNNTDFVQTQDGNIITLESVLDKESYKKALADTYDDVDPRHTSYWPDAPSPTIYTGTTVTTSHPSSPTAILPVRSTTSAIMNITTGSSLLGNYKPPVFPTSSSMIIVTEEAVTVPAIEPEYDTPEAINVMFLGAAFGDATLIEVGGAYALVDAGSDLDRIDIVRSLKYLGVEKIEYLILTNTKLDRIGGAQSVLDAFTVDNILLPHGVSDSTAYADLLFEVMTKANVKCPDAGDSFDLNGAEIAVLGPVGSTYANSDNLSTVLKVSYGDMDYLLMSDARADSENEIFLSTYGYSDLEDIEVISLADGGSAAGTTTEFINLINPSTIVISASESDTSLGNPSAERITELQAITPDVYTTSTSGSIRITSDGSTDFSIYTSY